MFFKRYTFFHGWIDDIQANLPNGERLLQMRLDSAQPILLTVFEPEWLLKPGNGVSVAVENSKPSHVVALVDHTAENGAILPCPAIGLFAKTSR